MSISSVLRRAKSIKSAAESEIPCTIPRRPNRSLVAFCVVWSRTERQLSIQALASIAGVSPSSIERIERGERVSDDTLRKVAVAVNQDEDAFTAERIPRSQDEVEQALKAWASAYEGMIAVPVSHFTKQRQVRELSRCDGTLVYSPHLCEDAQPLVEGLREWFELANFIRVSQEHEAFIEKKPFTRMRELNRDVLAAVREIERVGYATALTGCYDAEGLYIKPKKAGFRTMPIKAGLVAFFPKETDPCAIKRQVLWAPKQLEF